MTIPAVTGGATITSTWGNAVADDLNGRLLHREVKTTNSSYTTTITDLHASKSFDCRAGYSYRIYCEANVEGTGAGDSPGLYITDGSNNVKIVRYSYQASASRQQQVCCTEIYDCTTDETITRKTRVGVAAGTGQARVVATATAPAQFTIEEIGPTP